MIAEVLGANRKCIILVLFLRIFVRQKIGLLLGGIGLMLFGSSS